MIIRTEDVIFDPASVVDANGRVFWWRGEVYRAVTGGAASLYRTLLDSGAFERLTDAGMIGTKLTSLSLEGYDLILSHDTVRFRSHPFEWCDEMLKDAALLTCDVNLALVSIGLSTLDASCWNILFDGPVPKFIDFGSIVPGKLDPASWTGWYLQFQDFFLYPLHMMAQGEGGLARLLLADANGIVGRQGIMKLLPATRRVQCRIAEFRDSPRRFRSETSFLERLRGSVEDIRFPETARVLSGHCGERFPPFELSEDRNLQRQAVFEILQKLRPSSVVEGGPTDGWYSRLAASMGIPVVAFDVDEARVRSLYLDASSNGLQVLPVIMDVCTPSPRTNRGYGGFFPAARERLKGELVLGLGVVHHLFFNRGLGFDEIVERLATFADRWLLVDFVPLANPFVGARHSDRCGWYSTESLVAALRRRFTQVELFDFFPEPRQLLLCERKEPIAEWPGPTSEVSAPTPTFAQAAYESILGERDAARIRFGSTWWNTHGPAGPASEVPVRGRVAPKQESESISQALDDTAESLIALGASGALDRRFTRLVAVSARRYAYVARRLRATIAREDLEIRLCRGDLQNARREFLRVRLAYLSAAKLAVATPVIMAYPPLYAAILRRVRARRAEPSAFGERR